MGGDEGLEIVISAGAELEDRFKAMDAILALMPESSLLLILSREGTHVSANVTTQEDMVLLVMQALLMLLDRWRGSVGEAGAEQLFALFVTSVAERMQWRQRARKKQAN